MEKRLLKSGTVCRVPVLVLCIVGGACAVEDEPARAAGATAAAASGAGGEGGAGTGGSSAGGSNTGGSHFCTPGERKPCYTGPAGTEGEGICIAGAEVCLPDGSGFLPCMGGVTPQAEDCSEALDEDCDGNVDAQACYTGPAGTEGKGICKAGLQTCADDGTFGACMGETLPAVEDCSKPEDEDCTGLACSQALWSKLAGQDASLQTGFDVAVDTAGNVYIVGIFGGSFTFDGITQLTSAGTIDLFVAKLDANGGHVWSKQFGSAMEQRGLRIALDPNQDPVIVGWAQGSITFGATTLTAGGSKFGFVTKLAASSGAVTWATMADASPLQTECVDVAVDASGNVWVAVTSPEGSSGDAGAWMFDGASGQFVDGLNVESASVQARAVAVDPNGNAFLAGTFGETLTAGSSALVGNGLGDAFLIKVTGGLVSWAKAFGDAQQQHILALATDSQGNVLVTGYFDGAIDFGGGALSSVGDHDMFAAKLSPDGDHVWSKSFGSVEPERGDDIAVDEADNVLLTGSFNALIDFGGGVLPWGLGTDAYVVKLDSTGNHVWSKGFGDDDPQEARGLAAGPKQEVVITGAAEGVIDFGNGPHTSAGWGDVFVAKFAP